MISSVGYLLNDVHEDWRAVKPQVWLEYLQRVILRFVDWAAERTSDIVPFRPSLALLRCMCEGFDFALQKGILRLGSDESDTRDFRNCLALMHECLQVLRHADSLPASGGGDVKKAVMRANRDIQERAQLQIFVCESMQARQTGDKVLKKAVYDDEVINMELALQAVDYYRNAALLTRERDRRSHRHEQAGARVR